MENQATVTRPRRRRGYGVGRAFGTLTSSAVDVVEELARTAAPRGGRRRSPCPEPCGGTGSACQCECCVPDADLVVYARVGERRIVPLRIENTRSREREVTVAVGDFKTRGGQDAPVAVGLLGPAVLKVAPCSSEDATLVVEVGLPGRKPDEVEREVRERRELPDADKCLVAVGDLGLDGCDVRPARIAVAVVPRDCDPFEIECGCSCC
ncbi:MAG: hypothetical protein ICV71_01265 [Thermoleophilia bacterium]|nr:hypothetical protein [Thermoleophilia bacterium]